MKILGKRTQRDLQLLNDIGINIGNKEYGYDELYELSDKVVAKEVALINAAKKGEYNSVADEYNRIASVFIVIDNELYEKEN